MALLDIVIDVSHHQGGAIAWQSVAQAGIAVAMVKATEGVNVTDEFFHRNLREATRFGIRVIPYHFTTNDDVGDQIDHFTSVAGLKAGMAYALDWEGHRTFDAGDFEQMGRRLTDTFRRKPLAYFGIPGSGSLPAPPTQAILGWDRWVPRFRVKFPPGVADFSEMPEGLRSPELDRPFLFWQYTDHGRVAGINGRVDRSVAQFDTKEQLIQWFERGGQ